MCGIAGVYAYRNDAPDVDREELRRLRDHMAARGPDGCGEWFSEGGRIALGHRRLAIIDLSERGAQPMVSADGQLVISFNGEIYNYRALRAQLERKGYVFRSQSDTEVLLYLYAEKGEAMLEGLRGMYALALWDGCKEGLLLTRDPFGIKPLYYADDGTTLRVASQVKALLKGGRIDTRPEPAGHVGFYLWGHVPEPYTLYTGIRALPAGSTLWVGATGRHEINHFFSLTDELVRASETALTLRHEERQERLRAALTDTVRHHLIADVPVGIFLSSGLDSTTLTALAAEIGGSLRTVTLGFSEYQGTENDETPLAELVAKHYGASHQTRWVTRQEFEGGFQNLLEAMDQPTIDGVNSYFVSSAAASTGLKVALSGLGGDELLGGYPSFRQIPRAVRILRPFRALPQLGRGFRYLSAPLLKHFISPKYAGLLEYGGNYGGAYLLRRGLFMPWELPELLDGELVRAGWKELQTLSRLGETIQGLGQDALKVTALDTAWYMRHQLLRDTDWVSMAHSLEIRVPLVDIELMRAVVPLRATHHPPGKRHMARTPAKPLPEQILHRRKTGFSIPVYEWLLRDNAATNSDRSLRGWARWIYNTGLIVGDGTDRPRLEEKARSLGVHECVALAGYIPESEKADHYRLADAYVMPGRGEGFGIVYLEALACGVPVVASQVDGSREAVRDGALGILVDPSDAKDIKRGILEALEQPKGVVLEGLEYFSYANFEQRAHHIIDEVLASP